MMTVGAAGCREVGRTRGYLPEAGGRTRQRNAREFGRRPRWAPTGASRLDGTSELCAAAIRPPNWQAACAVCVCVCVCERSNVCRPQASRTNNQRAHTHTQRTIIGAVRRRRCWVRRHGRRFSHSLTLFDLQAASWAPFVCFVCPIVVLFLVVDIAVRAPPKSKCVVRAFHTHANSPFRFVIICYIKLSSTITAFIYFNILINQANFNVILVSTLQLVFL